MAGRAHALALASIAAATTWAAILSWRGFLVRPDDFLGPLLGVAVVIALAGGVLRGLGLPPLLTLLVQLVLTASAVCRAVAGGFLPTEATRDRFVTAMTDAFASAQEYAAPIPGDVPSVAPLLICGGAALLLLVDLLACGLRRVPLSGLALLAVYSVPAGISTVGSAWLSFLLATAGFLTLLQLDTRDRLLRWGHGLGPADGNPITDTNPVSDAVRAGAGRIGLTATALALAVPLVVPVMDVSLLGLRGGSGGNDQIQIRKPVVDMRRDLQRAADIPLLEVQTDDPNPEYLRIGVLNRYTGSEWSSGNRDVNGTNQADGRLPDPIGVAPEIPRQTYDYRVEVSDDFGSTWLPTQFPAAAVDAEGDWRFDPDTMDFLATDDGTTAGLAYEMTAIELDLGGDGRYFGDASALAADEEALDLPGGGPDSADFWAHTVTESATTDYQRATLLQQWFRSEFTYSLERAPEGTGNETLNSFLAPGGRVGYCEQFASAMAVMARILDIPARVAVGFLAPSRNDDGSWTYSSHDLHAWPELYFAGTGWVSFEPTPSGRVSSVPDYSRVPDPEGGTGTPGGTDPEANPTAPDNVQPTAPGPADAVDDTAGTDGAGSGSVWSGWPARITLLALLLTLVGGLALMPRWARERQRRERLVGGPDAIWDELRASAVDLGIRWPEGRSPRQVGAGLVPHLGAVDPELRGALDLIVTAVEHHRYARPGTPPIGAEELTDAANLVLAALAAGSTRRQRRRAVWLPRTTWARRRTEMETHVADQQPEPVG